MSEQEENFIEEIAHYRRTIKALIDMMLVNNTTAIGLRNVLEKYPDRNAIRPDRPALPKYKPNSILDNETTT